VVTVGIDPSADVFEPARSFGWVWLLALLAMVVAPLGMLFIPGAFEGEDAVGAWITIAVLLPLDIYVLVVLLSLPRMRYELGIDALVLRCGPFFKYRIPYAEITDVRRTTLTPTLWSSMRMPGLALGGVPYADVGTVRMCAKRMARDILLIGAGGKLYGITPAEEERFVRTLTPKLPVRSAGSPPASEG
jgi:hypothetical protein